MLNNLWLEGSPLVTILALIGLITVTVLCSILFKSCIEFVEELRHKKRRARRSMYDETFDMERYFLTRVDDQDQGTEELKATYKVWIEDSFHDYRTRI